MNSSAFTNAHLVRCWLFGGWLRPILLTKELVRINTGTGVLSHQILIPPVVNAGMKSLMLCHLFIPSMEEFLWRYFTPVQFIL
jgi:hypothetical protein